MPIIYMLIYKKAVNLLPLKKNGMCGFKDICWYIHTMFTWYGHMNLFNTVLTAAVSDLHYSTLWLQWQCLI
jgi:hypothetical protein